MEPEKRSRCTNFTTKEVETLVAVVDIHKSVVECKKTDACTNIRKEKVWEKITNSFNAVSDTGRTSTMLRSKWESLKKNSKKEYTVFNSSFCKPGGVPPKKLNCLVLKILKIVGIGGKDCGTKFDDNIAFSEGTENAVNVKMEPLEFIQSNNIESSFPDTSLPSCSYDIDVHHQVNETSRSSWSPRHLKEPINQLLRASPLQGKNGTIIPENRKTAKNLVKVKRKVLYAPGKLGNDFPAFISRKQQFERRLLRREHDIKMSLLKREADDKRIKLQEEHDIKMKIYELDLLLKQRQLAFLDGTVAD